MSLVFEHLLLMFEFPHVIVSLTNHSLTERGKAESRE